MAKANHIILVLSYSRRDETSISGYVRFIATKKTEQKTSEMGYFIFSTTLTPLQFFVDVCGNMTGFRENQFPAGKLAGVQTSGKTKHRRLFDNTGGGP